MLVILAIINVKLRADADRLPNDASRSMISALSNPVGRRTLLGSCLLYVQVAGRQGSFMVTVIYLFYVH